MSRSLRIAVADDERDMREYLQTVLPTLGHQVVAAAEDGRRLVEQCKKTHPDLVIADIKMPDMDGIAAAAEVNRERPTPIVLVSAYQDEQLLARARAENVMAYLVKPVKAGDLIGAITLATARFDENQALRQEAAALKQTLEERKLIERAKGSVMNRLRLDEAEAFRRLRKLASDQNLKLIDVSRKVMEAEDVFHKLDQM
jgi:response regulator NasT